MHKLNAKEKEKKIGISVDIICSSCSLFTCSIWHKTNQNKILLQPCCWLGAACGLLNDIPNVISFSRAKGGPILFFFFSALLMLSGKPNKHFRTFDEKENNCF